ncbi:FAD-dependent oxidoreductase [Rubellimicrobium rubrum]|uniref:FAD-dependent oxidoreductase n=1 Tax=Rubellimicrobium rubrum TaxID=2585369 RepID=UPI00319E0528
MAELERWGAALERTPVARITGERADVILADGREVPLDGLFTLTRTRPSGTLAEQLGCRLEDSPMGQFIAVDGIFRTSVPGVIACGDAARAAGSVAFPVGDAAMAGVSPHRSLIFGPE